MRIRRFRGERGATLVEYAVIVALLVVPMVAATNALQSTAATNFANQGNRIGTLSAYQAPTSSTTTAAPATTTTTAAPTTTTAAPTTTTTAAPTTTTAAPTTTTTAAPTTTTTVNQAPVVSNISKSCNGASCTMSVVASDPGGGSLTYSWTVNGTQYSTASSFSATAPATGTYNIAVTVKEPGNLTTQKTTTVTCTKPSSQIICS